MQDAVLGYSAMGQELERSALVNVFREWRQGWERNLKLFHHLPDEVQESIMAGSDDFVSATNTMMTSWVFLHPRVQRQHLEYMYQLETLAESVVSQVGAKMMGMTDDELMAHVDKLEAEVRHLRTVLTGVAALASLPVKPDGLVDGDDGPPTLIGEPRIVGDALGDPGDVVEEPGGA